MITRKELLAGAAGMGASPALARIRRSPTESVTIAIMGVNSRGLDLAKSFLATKQASVAAICDVDSRAVRKAVELVGKGQPSPPRGETDVRRILEDKSVDALVIAAPDHWHAPATIMACAAGKHVYVEKPASHNAREGELMVAAARKHNRVVQLGTQRRSMPAIIEGIDRLKSGEIGRVLFARGWYNNSRPSIGKGKPAPVPEWLDYSLWQGPAPESAYRDNVVHYNWHWFWRWGTGELGNNGIHALDVCRWGLGVNYPKRVTAGGGKYFYSDDQETPDSHVVTYDFGDKMITWEGRNWHRRGFEGSMFGIAYYGEKGSVIMDGGGYVVYGMDGKEIKKVDGSSSDVPHIQNFIDCVRSGKRPNADIEEGHKSTLLCHLGNIAYRTGRTLNTDSANGRILGDREAAELWTREYRKGWEPKV